MGSPRRGPGAPLGDPSEDPSRIPPMVLPGIPQGEHLGKSPRGPPKVFPGEPDAWPKLIYQTAELKAKLLTPDYHPHQTLSGPSSDSHGYNWRNPQAAPMNPQGVHQEILRGSPKRLPREAPRGSPRRSPNRSPRESPKGSPERPRRDTISALTLDRSSVFHNSSNFLRDCMFST